MEVITYFKNISDADLNIHLKCATSGLGLLDRFHTMKIGEVFQLNRSLAGIIDEQDLIAANKIAETDVRGNLLKPVIKLIEQETEKPILEETVALVAEEIEPEIVDENLDVEVTAEKITEEINDKTLTEEVNFVVDPDSADGFYHCPACRGKYATAKSYARHVSSKHGVNI